MKRIFVLLFGLLLLGFIISNFGCSKSGGETIRWQDDGAGFIQFYTNQKTNYGKSFWRSHYPIVSPMVTVTTEVKKISGYSGSGYGIVFCYQDNYNFYRLLITNDGRYTVIVKHGNSQKSTDTTLVPWPLTPSANLNTGYNVLNTIQITQSSPANFNISFNGTLEVSFIDDTLEGGKYGYFVYVGPTGSENFPSQPVDVRFNQTNPIPTPEPSPSPSPSPLPSPTPEPTPTPTP